MADTTAKEVEITVDRPFITNGKVLHGKVRVPMNVADDIKRREHEYQEYEKRLLRKDSETVHVKDIAVGQ